LQDLALPLPRIDDMLHKLQQSKYFVTLDLKSGFHQVPVKRSDQFILAFVMEDGSYTFTRAPFGIKTVPGYFQNKLNNILQENELKFCSLYVDDIILGDDTIDGLAVKLDKVLTVLDKHNIKLKGKKCSVGVQTVTYLGHQVSKNNIAIDQDRVKAIVDIPTPQSVKELKSFLGATGWLRKFLKNYGEIASVLHKLTHKKAKFEWTPIHDKAFSDIKKSIMSEPVLAPYDLKKYTVDRCDASRMGVGGVLLQGENDDSLRPIAYVSKSFNEVQQRWDTFDQEAFAVVHVLNKFRHFLIGRPFILETDHRNLVHLQSATTAKIERWYLRIADFSFETRHVPGRLNVVADFLSRHLDTASGDCSYVPSHHALAMALRQRPVLPVRPTASTPSNANDTQSSASDVASVADNSSVSSQQSVPELFDEDQPLNNVVDDFRPLLDETVLQMLKKIHNAYAGHLSVEHALWLLRKNNIVWPQMEHDVRLFIASCPVCQLTQDKFGSSNPSLGSTRAFELFQVVAVDTMTLLKKDEKGNTTIFVFVCCFSNFVELVAAKNKSAESAAEALLQVCGRYGVPEMLRSDQGKEYTNKIVTALLRLIECDNDFTLPYTPQTNGIVERRQKEVVRHLRALMVVQEQLKERCSMVLPLVQHVLNTTPSASGLTPMVTFFGDRVTPLRALFKKPAAEIDSSQEPTPEWIRERQRIHDRIVQLSLDYQRRSNPRAFAQPTAKRKYKASDIVLLQRRQGKPGKLDTLFVGPFRVLKVNSKAVLLHDLITDKRFEAHEKHLRPFVAEDHVDDNMLQRLAAKTRQDEYVVEEIVNHRLKSDKSMHKQNVRIKNCEFQVHWLGHDHSTWEPYNVVKDLEALTDYIDLYQPNFIM